MSPYSIVAAHSLWSLTSKLLNVIFYVGHITNSNTLCNVCSGSQEKKIMMWYNGPRHHRYYRHYRGPRFPWIVMPFLFFFFASSHLGWLMLASLILILLFIAIRSIASSAMNTRNQQTSNYTTPSYYQPPTQNSAPQYYEPYYQGYRAPVPTQSPTPEYYTPERQQDDPYQTYDQPKAEYPQQMPPM
jgi:hypothetical protein